MPTPASFAMLYLIFQAILVYGVSFAFWRVVRQYVVKTSLDNIPAPPSPSFFKGTIFLLAKRSTPEHLSQETIDSFLRLTAGSFTRTLQRNVSATSYIYCGTERSIPDGGVVKVKALFGVRHLVLKGKSTI